MEEKLERYLLSQSVVADVARIAARKCAQRLGHVNIYSGLGSIASASRNNPGALVMIGAIGEGQGAITAIERPNGEAIRNAATQLYWDSLRFRP